MKDSKGHGSNSKGGSDWNKSDFDNAAAMRAGRAAHQTAVEDVGRLKGWEGAIKDQVRRFAKSESGAGRVMPGAGEGFDAGDVGEWMGRLGSHIANGEIPGANEMVELATRIAPHMVS
jgi:hypothetical protein